MSHFTSVFIAPVYRLFYGPPLSGLNDPSGTSRGGGDQRQRPLAIVADGVGGLDVCGTGLRYVMGAAGLSHAIEVYPWGHGFGRWLADLTDVRNRDAKARSIAEMVTEFKIAQPDEPVFLVAKSGGSGVVVKALELLDRDAVERVILLAPALSPRYDLSHALRAVRHEMVVFWSPLDVFILGLGTLIFGTIDRARTAGAGLVSFVAPALDDPVCARSCQYAKLRQIRWRPAMMTTGYLGGHFGLDSPLFLKEYVLPLMRPAIGPDH
jgi:Serine aminopeptidase, S33